MISLALKVTASLVESNDSLPLGLLLRHLRVDCQQNVPNARNRVWDYSFFTHLVNNRIHNHTAKCAGDVCRPVLLSHMCDHFEYNCMVDLPAPVGH